MKSFRLIIIIMFRYSAIYIEYSIVLYYVNGYITSNIIPTYFYPRIFAVIRLLTYPDAEIVERVFVNVGQLLAQTERVVGHGGDVRVLFAVARVFGQTGRGHVRGPGRFDLLDALETLLAQQLVKVRDDLVQQPQTLHALVVGFQFHVELREVRYRREHYAHGVALFVVQFLRARRITRVNYYAILTIKVNI